MDVESARSFLNFSHEMSRNKFKSRKWTFQIVEFERSRLKSRFFTENFDNMEFKYKDE